MSYNSLLFVALLPIILLGYYVCPSSWRNSLLLAVSVALYMLWWPGGIVVLAWVSIVSFLGIKKLNKHPDKHSLWLVIAATLLPLLFFKYLQPLNTAITQALHIQWFLDRHHWLIPVGLSFYTLQTIGLEVDAYRGRRFAVAESLVDHALFVSFFPIVSSGPIVRGDELLTQLRNANRQFDASLFWQGLRWIIWGMFMKLAVAEPFFQFVSAAEIRMGSQSGFTLFLSTLCYTIELYADFAGYSLMAIGTTALFGIRLRHNFIRPLFAVGVRDFWRRWHISLSTWLRDYIYIPLGGSHCPHWRTSINLFITFLVSGLWHGAGLTYLLWGIVHGLWVNIERWVQLERWTRSRLARFVVGSFTFVCASFLFILFRHDLSTSLSLMSRIFTDFLPITLSLTPSIGTRSVELTMVTMFGLMMAKELRDEFFPNCFAQSHALKVIVYACVMLLTLTFGVVDNGAQFIYMHF